MKIESVTCYPLRIPGHPYVGGHDERKNTGKIGDYTLHANYRAIYTLNAESLIVKISTDTGIVGWGETQSAILPHVVAKIVEELVAPGLIGHDPFNVSVLRDRAYDRMRDRGHDSGLIVDAISACDIALWDILGKATGKPVYKLLGGNYRNTVPCYVSGVPALSVQEQAESISRWRDDGFNRFKISLGYNVREDIAHMKKLRDAVGDEPQLLVDSHWAFDINQAIKIGRAFENLNVELMECPLDSEIVAKYSELCRTLDLPIALGEEFRTRFRFKERIDARALDIAQPDIGRLGITEGMRVIALCGAAGLPVAPHIGSGLGPYTAASLHVAAATENLLFLEFQPTQIDVCEKYFKASLRPVKGAYELPEVPGLGVEPLDDTLKKYAFSK